jgi:hypothetical protein
MAGRVTQLVVEAVIAPTSAAVRTTQVAVEAVVVPDTAAVRTTQVVVEAVVAPTTAAVRTTHLLVEAVVAPYPNLVVSFHGLEVARFGDPNVLISQSGLEVARTGYPNLIVSQVGMEVAWELPKGTFALDAWILPPPIPKTFGMKSVYYGYAGTPIVIKEGQKGQPVEFVIPGCDLTIAGSPITITWDVWQSHFQWSVDKKEVVRLRRDSLTGLVMWTDDPQKDETDSGNAATGAQWHFSGTYQETARSGRYVLTVLPSKGNATLYASSIFFSLATPGDGPGITFDAIRGKTQTGSFGVRARILKPAGPITMPDWDLIDAVIFRRDQAGSFSVGGILYIWGLGAFITSAHLGKTATETFTVGAHIQAISQSSFAADALVAQQGTGSTTLDALVKGSHFTVAAFKAEVDAGYGSTQIDAIRLATVVAGEDPGWVEHGWLNPGLYRDGLFASSILSQTTVAGFSASALILGGPSRALGLGAVLEGPTPDTFTADAFFSGTIFLDAVIKAIGVCVWTTPGDTVEIGQNESLAFLIPFAYRKVVFEIQLDRVATFDSPELRRIHSLFDPGWEYWDGTWLPMPSAGVDPAFAGNEARYTIQDPLLGGVWFRRVRAGVV